MIWSFTLLAVSLYAITGGPAVGKTSIINALSEKGECVVQESAIDLIIEEQAKGIKTPWTEEGFEIKIFNEKLRREKKVIEEASLHNKSRVFTDRGLLDSLAYIKFLHKEKTPDALYILEELNHLKEVHRYDAVFYVEPYNGSAFVKPVTENRHENTAESLLISKITQEIYASWDIPIITVPSGMTPHERASFLISQIEQIEKTNRR